VFEVVLPLGGWAIANMAGTSPMPKTHVVLAFEALLPVIINYMLACTVQVKKVGKSTRWIGLAVTSYIFMKHGEIIKARSLIRNFHDIWVAIP
jgi:hypothetical protein